jgi:uncharacterized membrane protein
VPNQQAGEFMNTLISMAVGALSLLVSGVALAQTGNMMDGGGRSMGWMGGYGGIWGAVLLGAVAVAVVVLLMNRKAK